MKKFLIGCGVVSLLLVVGGGLAAYHFVFKPAAQIAGSVIGSAREVVTKAGNLAQTIEAMRAMEAEVVARDAFVPPADGALGAAQIERFLAVHAAVVARLGPERERLAQAVEGTPGSGEAASLVAPLTALASLGELGLAAKRAQVDALNAQGLSLAEYRWIRQTGIEALVAGGVKLGIGNERVATLWRQAQQAAAQAAEAARALGETLPGGLVPPPDGADPGAAPPAQEAVPSDPQPPALSPVQRANFDLVREHREAFAQSQLLALADL